MNIPGFTAEASLLDKGEKYLGGQQGLSSQQRMTVAPATIAGFGGFGPTLPSCHYEKQMVVCGSALPGYPVPMCPEWVYVCRFPGSSRSLG
jgi:hypothetical protein